jgi:prepilin-type N-terminal cleavage/methylation domain-containing protein
VKSRAGFTLIELCLVLGLLAALLTFSWPALKTAHGHYTVETAADQLRNAFERARLGAVIEQCRYQIEFQSDPPAMTLMREDFENKGWRPAAGRWGKKWSLPAGLKVEGPKTVFFYSNGTATGGEWRMTGPSTLDVSIQLSGSLGHATITTRHRSF